MKRKVIFLDVDGVLNGYNIFTDIMFKTVQVNSKLYKFIRTHYDLFDAKLHKIFLLSIIVKFTKADIVMSSTWRGTYKHYLKTGELDKRMATLVNGMKKCKIFIIDTTPRISSGRRGEEIQMYLNNHPEIDKFVILDDEKFDMMNFLESGNLILTSTDGNIRGLASENTGLKIKHVIKAIKLLGIGRE